MRITPHWHYESVSRQPVDSVDGTVEQTIKTSGFDLTGIDILTGGTLAKNVSFLLVPSIDGVVGTVGFESANIRLDNIKGSPWVNLKFGKFELDGPLSEKRMMSFSNTGGAYQLYHYVPVGDINDFTVGENQLGIELMGHSLDDHTRYAASLISSTNGGLGLPGGRSHDGFLHLSQGFMAGKLGLQREGHYLYSPKHLILGRYELVRMSRQPLSDLPSDFGNVDVFTAAYRFYPFINSRAGFAWHIEFSTLKSTKTAESGADQHSNSFFTGFDFAF